MFFLLCGREHCPAMGVGGTAVAGGGALGLLLCLGGWFVSR